MMNVLELASLLCQPHTLIILDVVDAFVCFITSLLLHQPPHPFDVPMFRCFLNVASLYNHLSSVDKGVGSTDSYKTHHNNNRIVR